MSDAPGGMDEATRSSDERRAASYSLAAVHVKRSGDHVWSPNTKEQLCEAVERMASEADRLRLEVRRLSAALAEQQRENERQADLIDEFRKRNESQDRIRKRLISERDALQVDNSVQFDRAEAAEAALADAVVALDDVRAMHPPRSVDRKLAALRHHLVALAAAPSGEPNQSPKENDHA